MTLPYIVNCRTLHNTKIRPVIMFTGRINYFGSALHRAAFPFCLRDRHTNLITGSR